MHARFAFLGAVLLAAALAACGGGGGGGPTPATPSPTCPPGTTGTVTLCSGLSLAAPIPVAAGATTTYAATMNFPAGTGTATIAASTTAPSGAATLDAAHLRIATAGGTVRAADSAPYTTLAYITLTATSALSLSSVPTITVTTPSGAAGAYYNSQGYWVTLPQSGTFTLASGAAAYFAIYTGGTLPSPNPDGCVGVQTATRPNAHAAAVGVQPIDQGASFSYTGTLTEAIARATPCAMPTATQQATVSVTVTITSSPYSPSDEHSVESDAYSTETTSTITDANVAATTVGGAAGFSESAETSTDEVGDTTVTTYSTPLVYAISSPLPYSGTITNGPPSTVKATLADNTTTDRTYDTSNGSYSESDSIAGGGANTITVNADFSGSYVVATGAGQLTAAYSAPSSGSITFTELLAGQTLSSFAIPQWWTGTSLYSDTTVDKGAGALPSPCNPTGVSSADDFRRTISIIDPVLGYTETETIDAYVASSPTVGPACVVIADTQKLYYDYFYDTPYSIYLSGSATPLQTDTIAEAYWYASPPSGDSSVRTQSENPGGIPGLAANIAAHASGIAFTRATQRAQRIENFVRSLAAGHIGGAK